MSVFRARAVVAGGAVFIGSHLCERLLADNYEVICIDNFSTGNKAISRHASALLLSILFITISPNRSLFGGSTAIRDYVRVTDLADAHVKTINHLRTGGTSGALNLGTGRGYPVREVVETLERVTGLRVPTRVAVRRAGDPSALYAQPDRAKEILGWDPRCSDLETIIETAFAWHRKHHYSQSAVSAC